MTTFWSEDTSLFVDKDRERMFYLLHTNGHVIKSYLGVGTQPLPPERFCGILSWIENLDVSRDVQESLTIIVENIYNYSQEDYNEPS